MKKVLFARVRVKGLQLRSTEKKKKRVMSLNACILIVSHGMKFRIANKCLYSKKEQ